MSEKWERVEKKKEENGIEGNSSTRTENEYH